MSNVRLKSSSVYVSNSVARKPLLERTSSLDRLREQSLHRANRDWARDLDNKEYEREKKKQQQQRSSSERRTRAARPRTATNRVADILASPGARLAKSSRIVETIMFFLTYPGLLSASQVNRLWRRCANAEKRRRDNWMETDCIVLELRRTLDVEDEDETTMRKELHQKFAGETFSNPNHVITFITYHTINEPPEFLFDGLPDRCHTTVVASENGVIASDRRGEADIFWNKNRECLGTLALPLYDGAKVLPFAVKDFKSLTLKNEFFDEIGLMNPEMKKLVKGIVIFVQGHGAQLEDPNYVRHTRLQDLRRDFYQTMQYQTAIAGSTVTFAQHDIKSAEKHKRDTSSAYKAEHLVKGLVFAGKHVEVKTVVIDRQRTSDSQLAEYLGELAEFYRNDWDKFVVMLVGAHADYDKFILRWFKSRFPKIPVIGLRTMGSVFGNVNNSESLAENRRGINLDEELFLGDYAVLVAVKLRNVSLVKKAEPVKTKLKYYRIK